MSSETVWFEQIDSALLAFIKSHVFIDNASVKAVVRKPDDDFNEEEYPVVTVYNLYDRFSRERYSPEPLEISRDPDHNRIVMEKSALPYDLYYQIDFWATRQVDMNEMTRQWRNATGLYFNLDVVDMSGISRSCFVLSRNDFNKSDLMQNGKRLFHSFGTYRIYTEIDEREQTLEPMVTETLIVNTSSNVGGS
jgi:hypothetical protein